MRDYDRFEYLTPYRPDTAIPPDLLGFYERRGWWCQVKKNGTNNVVFVPPRGDLVAMGRHNNHHKQWGFTAQSAQVFRRFQERRDGGWFVFNAELLHSKVKGGVKDTNFIHDLLVDDGERMAFHSFADRYKALFGRLERYITDEKDDYYVLNSNTWLAKVFRADFFEVFESLTADEDEGLVLKRPGASMMDKSAMVKCRRPKANYTF